MLLWLFFWGSSFSDNFVSRKLKRQIEQTITDEAKETLGRVVCTFMFVVSIIYVAYGFFDSGAYWQCENRWRERAERIEEQKDRVFVVPVGSSLVSDMNAYGLWHMPPNGLSKNVFYLGGWSQRAPYKLKLREQLGVRNPFTALVENPTVYSSYSEQVHGWLCEFYQDSITMSTVDTIDDVEIVQYSGVIDVNKDVNAKQYNMTIQEINDTYLKGKVQAKMDDFAQYEDVRLNIRTMEGVKTFRLQPCADGFTAKLYGDYETEILSAWLIAKDASNQYICAGNLNVDM